MGGRGADYTFSRTFQHLAVKSCGSLLALGEDQQRHRHRVGALPGVADGDEAAVRAVGAADGEARGIAGCVNLPVEIVRAGLFAPGEGKKDGEHH